MECPRCHLPLRKETYEGVEIDLCDQCWGSWLDKGELPGIIKAEELEFGEADEASVLNLKEASNTGPRGALLCPRCSTFMEQLRLSGTFELLLDRCPADGLWLDTGELKKVQMLAESSAAFRSLVIRKLKGLGGAS